MTIDEAIEIKSRTGEEFLHTDPDKLDEADRLSIEALKEIKHLRTTPACVYLSEAFSNLYNTPTTTK